MIWNSGFENQKSEVAKNGGFRFSTFGFPFAVLLTVLLIAGCQKIGSSSGSALPEGWIRATVPDFSATEDMRFRTPNDLLSAKGDFNGDGRPDEAVLALNKSKGVFDVFVLLSGAEVVQLVERPIREASRIGVVAVKPGTYETACGKGYDVGVEDCPSSVTLNVDGISIAVFESSENLYHWDGMKFVNDLISD